MDSDQKIWEQVTRRIADEKRASDREENLTSDSQERLQIAQKVWDKSQLPDTDYLPDTEKGWQRMQLKIRMRQPQRPYSPYWRAAAIFLVLLFSSFILYTQRDLFAPEQLVVTADTGIKRVDLPDGSTAWLNTGATLSFAERFMGDDREVKLRGEAFFEVTKAEGKTFSVIAGKTRTTVLGTSFNITARQNEEVKVQVTTGRVSFQAKDQQSEVILSPGEESTYEPAQTTLNKKPIEDLNYRAWQSKQLVFSNTPFTQLAQTLEKYFTITIQIPDALQNCRFTGTFKDPRIDQILEVLAISGNLEVIRTIEGYQLTGEKCK